METEVKIVELPIAPEALWLVVALVLIFFITISMIFTYHWKKYGVDNNPKIFAKSLYWIVSIILIVIMTVAVSAFDYL